MITIKMKGRLGNQLFQYAFAKELAERTNDKDIVIDWEYVDSRHIQNDDGWEDSLKDFQTNYTIGKGEINFIQSMLWEITQIVEKLTWKMGKWLNRSFEIPSIWAKFISVFGVYYYRNGYIELSMYPITKNKIIYGYFESPKYFSGVDDIIRNEITPKYPTIKGNQDLLKKIEEKESICLTIRRGDFYTEENSEIYGVCNENYYYQGIKYIKTIYPDAIVVVFSDDIKWAKDNIRIDGEVYFESGIDPLWEKVRLMASCKHFVISNSTFSWWVQHLSSNPNKIVIAPSVWRKDGKKNDIFEPTWICL